MEHTDKLKAEIKELKAENKKLKNRNMYKNLRSDIEKLQNANEKQQKDIEDLFQVWLLYWSDGKLGKEHDCPMSFQDDGKYQKLMDELD